MKEFPPYLKIRHSHTSASGFSVPGFRISDSGRKQLVEDPVHVSSDHKLAGIPQEHQVPLSSDSTRRPLGLTLKVLTAILTLIAGTVTTLDYLDEQYCNQDGSDRELCASSNPIGAWEDITSEMNGFDLECEYEWLISQADDSEGKVWEGAKLTPLSVLPNRLEFSFGGGNYLYVNHSNKNLGEGSLGAFKGKMLRSCSTYE